MPGFIRSMVATGAAVLLAGAVTVTMSTSARAGTSVDAPISLTTNDWPTYHHDNARSALGSASPKMTTFAPRWSFHLPKGDPTGQIYGEPVEAGHTVVIATESDWVYGIDIFTGALRWRDHLATPSYPVGVCGNISPSVGITSTPVIDAIHGEVFVVAAVGAGSGAHGLSHHLFGLSLRTGAVRLNRVIDPPGQQPLYLLQRAALGLVGNNVLVSMGGNYGDCGDYHGWLLSIDGQHSGAPIVRFEVASGPGQYQGALWMGGAAPAIDATGRIFVATGNGSATSPGDAYDRSDSVLAFSPSLRLVDQFAPATWTSDNANDLDLGSAAPQLLRGGLLFQIGKSGTGYLLGAHALGGVGAAVPTVALCTGGIAVGGAVTTSTGLVVACTTGLTALTVTQTPRRAAVAWTSPVVTGPAVSAAGWLWGISGDPSQGWITSINPGNGHRGPFSAAIGGLANHFSTPAIADGFVLAASSRSLTAFPIH